MVVGDRSLADEAGIDLDPQANVWVNQRFEIALNGETLEVLPDGPSVKVWTRLPQICLYGIDPGENSVRPFVVTVPETYWWGSVGPFLPRPVQGKTMRETGSEVANVVLAEMEGSDFRPLPREPGGVVGLQRLVLDGSVQRTSELFPDLPPQDDTDEA